MARTPTSPSPAEAWREAFANQIGATNRPGYDLSVLTADELRVFHALLCKIEHKPLSAEDEDALAGIAVSRERLHGLASMPLDRKRQLLRLIDEASSPTVRATEPKPLDLSKLSKDEVLALDDLMSRARG